MLKYAQSHANQLLIARHRILEKVTVAIMNVFNTVMLLHINFWIVTLEEFDETHCRPHCKS